MDVVTKIGRMREVSRGARTAGRRIGLVPTMGALHEGHLSLVRRARQVSDVVILSVFVNPAQFAPEEDLERYPRDLTRDAELAAKEGVEFVFAPSVAEMYPEGYDTYVEVQGLSGILCGASRPTHFRGVTTVVMKLFQIVCPDVAIFGAKDFQQAVVVRRMARDLNLGVEIHVAPTVREDDGLALSSRNAYLSAEERKAATVLRRSLDEAERLFSSGERTASGLEAAVRKVLDAEPLAEVEYASVVHAASLEPVERLEEATLVAVAARIGGTRLIDNTVLELEKS
jgi:pantoate--beta-alanine ligase